MFNVQNDFQNHEIYINYNEFLSDEEDESILILEHVLNECDHKGYKGIIDLISVKSLTKEEIKRLKKMHDILQSANISEQYVICDNKKLLKYIKNILPDIKPKLFTIES